MLNKLLTKLQQKYSKNPLFQEGGFLALAKETNMQKKIPLPLFRLLFSPFNQVLDNGKIFFALVIPVSLLICLSSSILGFNYLCAYSPKNPDLFCSESLLGYFCYNIIKMLLWAYVGIKWYEYVFTPTKPHKSNIVRIDKRYLKLAGYLLLFLLLNMLPMLSWWVLYVRVPNPDWRIEMVFFAFVSIGFIIPLLLLRCYAILGFVMRGEKVPSFFSVWHQTSGNSLKIFSSYILILIVGIFIFGNLYSNFKVLSTSVNLYNLLMSEFIYGFFSLFLYIVVLNNLNLQYEILFRKEDDVDDGN